MCGATWQEFTGVRCRRARKGLNMASASVNDRLESEFRLFEQRAAHLSFDVPGTTLAAVRALPYAAALQTISGIAAPSMRSPVGFLPRQESRQRRESVVGASAAPRPCGERAPAEQSTEVAKRMKQRKYSRADSASWKRVSHLEFPFFACSRRPHE